MATICRNKTGQFAVGFKRPEEWNFKIVKRGSDNHLWKGGKIKVSCLFCGKEFLTWSGDSNRSKYCSRRCYWEDRIGKFIGEKAGHWKNGITPLTTKIRNSERHKIWANKIYRKDRWICQECGIKCQKKNIIAHHIKSFSEYPELRFDVDNGTTLCRECHAKIHKLGIVLWQLS